MATPTVFQVPPIDKRKRIPMKTIRAIAKHIARKFDVDVIARSREAIERHTQERRTRGWRGECEKLEQREI